MTIRPTQFYDAYVFDLDGTVYLGDALLPNAQRAITTIRTQGKRIMFLSNNPTRTRQECAAELKQTRSAYVGQRHYHVVDGDGGFPQAARA